MRITNNMIMNSSKSNVGGVKGLVDKYNTQMTTQKKINKASENPVIAIRSLRMSTSMTHIDQFKENNIPDAEAWLDVTHTALTNMKSILTDVRTQCVNGSTDSLTADDRSTILKQLTSLVDQVYAEGNSDYAGRTVFTGYRTSSDLTFLNDTDANAAAYKITQNFDMEALEEHRYYTSEVVIPTSVDATSAKYNTPVEEKNLYRVRLAYGGVDADFDLVMKKDGLVDNTITFSQANGNVFETAADFSKAIDAGTITADSAVLIKETGEMVFGKNVADSILTNDYEMEVSYMKFGFDAEDARPEYYYNCTDYSDCVYTKNDVGSVVDGVTVTDEMVGKAINPTLVDKKAIEFTYDSQPISYTVANNTELTVNTQAKDVFDTGIRRDINEMIDIVQKAISAHDKVDRITSMMKETQYVDDKNAQEVLQTYLDAAKKEADYADSNLQKTYGDYITRFDKHLAKVNSAITEVGNTQSRLSLIQTRVENQYTTIEELKSLNEDRDLSDVIIDYTAVYNAYQASLMATSKVGQTSLLDYL